MVGFKLPLQNTPAREALGDMETIVSILDPANLSKLPCFSKAIRIQVEPGTRVNIVCLRADDERWLISVGPKGGWKKIWNFGRGR